MGGGHKRFRGIFVAAIFMLAGVITAQQSQAFSPHSCHESGSCESSGGSEGDFSGDEGDFEGDEGDFSGDEGEGSGGDGGFGGESGDNSVTVTVQDEAGKGLAEQDVAAFCGMSFGNGTTDSSGNVTITGLTNGNCGAEMATNNGYYSDFVFFTFAQSDDAQTTEATLVAKPLDLLFYSTLLDSDGNPAAEAYMVMTDSSGHDFSGPTDSEGKLTWQLHADTYTVSGYNDSGAEYIVNETIAVTTSEGSQTFQMKAYSSFVKGTVVSASSGDALSSARVVIFSEDSGMRMETAGDDGTFSLALKPGTYTIKAEKSGYANGLLSNVTVKENQTLSDQSIELTDAKNSVTVTAVTEDGETLSVSGALMCHEAGNESDVNSMYFKPLSSGAAKLSLPDGSYTCRTFSDGYVVVKSSDFTVSGGETKSVKLTMAAFNATISVTLTDQDGNTLSSTRFGVSGVSEDGYVANGFSPGGATSLGVVAGTYQLQPYIFGSGYTTDFSAETSVTVTEGGTANATLVVYKQDATIAGTVTDASGTVVEGAVIRAVAANVTTQADASDEEGGLEFSTTTDSSGVYTLPVVAGTYEVITSSADHPDLPAEHSVVSVSKNATEELELHFSEASATLQVAPDGVNADDIDGGSCYAYETSTGVYANTELGKGTAELDVTAGTWKYGCRVIVGDVEYMTVSEEEVVVDSGATVDAGTSVSEGGKAFESVLTQFTDSTATQVQLPDGTEVQIPANTFDVNGDTVTLSVQQAQNVPAEDGLFPFRPIEITASDSNGRVVSGNFQGTVSIVFPYSEDDLAAFGIDESTLTGHTLKEDAWTTTDQGYVVNTKSNTVTVTTNHFSTFGLMAQKGSAAVVKKSVRPGVPRALKATNVKSSSAVLTWKKPKSGTLTKYMVQVRRFKSQKKKGWTTYKKVEGKQRTVEGFVAGTRYEFRVRACNGKVCGKYSQWGRFTTKK